MTSKSNQKGTVGKKRDSESVGGKGNGPSAKGKKRNKKDEATKAQMEIGSPSRNTRSGGIH